MPPALSPYVGAPSKDFASKLGVPKDEELKHGVKVSTQTRTYDSYSGHPRCPVFGYFGPWRSLPGGSASEGVEAQSPCVKRIPMPTLDGDSRQAEYIWNP